MKAAALKLARAGLRVHPLHAPVLDQHGVVRCDCRRGAACDAIGKHPRLKGWQQRATSLEEQVAELWDAHPQANIGIRLGDGICVLDVDPRNGGAESLATLEEEQGELHTLTARTGGGGLHLYFAGNLKNTTGKVGAGLDTKGKGGLVVAPPSLHASGRRYQWVDTSVRLAVVPRWLRNRVDPPRIDRTYSPPPVNPSSKYLETAVRDECTNLASTQEGGRNDALNRAAYALARFVADGTADAAYIVSELQRAARACGLRDSEINATLTSAFRSRGAGGMA